MYRRNLEVEVDNVAGAEEEEDSMNRGVVEHLWESFVPGDGDSKEVGGVEEASADSHN